MSFTQNDTSTDIEKPTIVGEPDLNLFEASGIRNKKYWQCIRYIAPTCEKRKWKSSDAMGVYCTVCEVNITYDFATNPMGVQSYMEKYHKTLLKKFEQKNKLGEPNTRENHSINSFFPKKPKIDEKRKANAANQAEFARLSALWICTSLRPYSIVEDPLLQEMIHFSQSVQGVLSLPSRNTNKTNIMKEYNKMKGTILKDRTDNCEYFASTSDMWSSKSMKAFMALTVHYLAVDFEPKNYTLEVKPLQGKHTEDMIRQKMMQSFQKWGLTDKYLTMMIRDSGSNMVKACKDWNISHFSCIGHSLHLVVGSFHVTPKKDRVSTFLTEEFEDHDDSQSEDDIEDLWNDMNNSEMDENELVEEVRSIVQGLRQLCIFIKNSTKCTEKMEFIQKNLTGKDKTLKIKMDVRTRWNSTLDMLLRAIQLMNPINEFLAYYNSATGIREFKGVKTKLNIMSDETWAILKGIWYLLSPFDKATTLLSDEKYSTFVSALPVLRKVKFYLSDPFLFDFNGDHLSKSKQRYFDLYGGLSFFDRVVQKLMACQSLLIKQFNNRFNCVDISILWTSLLDPRFGVKSPHWSNENEKEKAKELLLKEVEN